MTIEVVLLALASTVRPTSLAALVGKQRRHVCWGARTVATGSATGRPQRAQVDM